jgi:hypothetical protein
MYIFEDINRHNNDYDHSAITITAVYVFTSIIQFYSDGHKPWSWFLLFLYTYYRCLRHYANTHIHVIVSNLQMKTYVFHQIEIKAFTCIKKRKTEIGSCLSIRILHWFYILASYTVRLAIIIVEDFFFLLFLFFFLYFT